IDERVRKHRNALVRRDAHVFFLDEDAVFSVFGYEDVLHLLLVERVRASSPRHFHVVELERTSALLRFLTVIVESCIRSLMGRVIDDFPATRNAGDDCLLHLLFVWELSTLVPINLPRLIASNSLGVVRA